MVRLEEALDEADSATSCLPTSNATPHSILLPPNNATRHKQQKTKTSIFALTTDLSRVLELPCPHQLGNAVLVADEGLHAVAKRQVEVDGDAAAGGHGAGALAVENGHLNRKPKHVGQRQTEVPPGL